MSPFAILNCYIYESVQGNRSLTIKTLEENASFRSNFDSPWLRMCTPHHGCMDPDMDIEELMKKISPKKKLLKEKLLSKLLWGGIIAFLGIALLGYCIVQGYVGGMPTAALQQFSLFGAVLLGIGIAFLINYYVGRKLLAKEIDAEEKFLVSQAENK